MDTVLIAMLGSKGCKRMPLVSSCEINTGNKIKLFKNLCFSLEISKKDDFKKLHSFDIKSTTWHEHQ